MSKNTSTLKTGNPLINQGELKETIISDVELMLTLTLGEDLAEKVKIGKPRFVFSRHVGLFAQHSTRVRLYNAATGEPLPGAVFWGSWDARALAATGGTSEVLFLRHRFMPRAFKLSQTKASERIKAVLSE